jgi:hypothetical protein
MDFQKNFFEKATIVFSPIFSKWDLPFLMEQRTLKNANKCWNTKISLQLETSGGQNFNLDLNVVH